jgi:hypothetical protein
VEEHERLSGCSINKTRVPEEIKIVEARMGGRAMPQLRAEKRKSYGFLTRRKQSKQRLKSQRELPKPCLLCLLCFLLSIFLVAACPGCAGRGIFFNPSLKSVQWPFLMSGQ